MDTVRMFGRPSKERTTPPFPPGPYDWAVAAVGYGLSFGFAIFLPLWSRSPWMLIFSGLLIAEGLWTVQQATRRPLLWPLRRSPVTQDQLRLQEVVRAARGYRKSQSRNRSQSK